MTSTALPETETALPKTETAPPPSPSDLMQLSDLRRVPVAALKPGDRARLDGETPEQVEVLAETESALPPLIVHRPTMQIIDGHHRWQAAKRQGREQIEVRFFHGTLKDAFVVAVQANTTHGWPLSRRDRRAAVERILSTHPHWSDRVIAAASGITAKTVGRIRRNQEPSAGTATARLGRDGRLRPISNDEGRRRAGDLLAENPNASLREIAGRAGISPGTVRDVRARLQRGEPALLPPRAAQSLPDAAADRQPALPPAELATRLQVLERDPSLRLTDGGRHLLRLLHAALLERERVDALVDVVPVHCASRVAQVADSLADVWQDMAQQLRERGRFDACPEPR